jgi:hypothetical protein
MEKATIRNTSRGAQIACIPRHANGNIKHKDVEYGFITSKTANGAFCRYWHKKPHHNVLRTTANSELTPWDCLVLYESHTKGEVSRLLDGIDQELRSIQEGLIK